MKKTTINIIGCGGAGCKLTETFSKYYDKKLKTYESEISPNLVFKKYDLDNKGGKIPTTVIKSPLKNGEKLYGSGGERIANFEVIKDAIYRNTKEMVKIDKDNINIVIFGSGSGSGSVIGPVLIDLIKKSGGTAIAMIIVDTFTKKNTVATIGTFKTLEGLAKISKYVLPTIPFENIPTTHNLIIPDDVKNLISAADNKLLSKLALLLPFMTNHDDLDMSDVLATLSPEKNPSIKINPGVKKLDVTLNGEYYLKDNILSVKSITPIGHGYKPAFTNLADFKVDKPNAYTKSFIEHFNSESETSTINYPLELLLADLGYGTTIRACEEKLNAFEAEERKREESSDAIEVGDENDGFFF